jgi:hypothetical protein
MAGLKTTGLAVAEMVARVTYQLRNLLTASTPVHLVVCGPDDQTAQALMQRIPTLFAAKDVSVVWGQALWARHVRSRVIVSFDSDDAARSDTIDKVLSPTRHVVFVLAVGNPRELVCERSSILPHHFSQGADYRLHVDGRIRSLTQPGVMSRSTDALEVSNRFATRALIIRREEFRTNPKAVMDTIARAVSRFQGPVAIPGEVSEPAEGGGASEGAVDTTEREKRMNSQRTQFPELDKVAEALGYPSPPTPVPVGHAAPRGLIIAFHTPDDVYQAEADRLRKSLEALGLAYEISVVEPESNWVRTTLLKPTWITPARKRLRGPLLYLDVDAYVHHDPWPYVADMDADMAAVVQKNGQLYSATLWINDTAEARDLLDVWAEGSGSRRDLDKGTLHHTGDDGDQGVLKLIVEAEEARSVPRFRFGRLAPNLATIFDRDESYRYGPIVIEQLQVSREVALKEKRLARRRARLAELGD